MKYRWDIPHLYIIVFLGTEGPFADYVIHEQNYVWIFLLKY